MHRSTYRGVFMIFMSSPILRCMVREKTSCRQAFDELIELVGAVDGLLQEQATLDVRNFERYVGRTLRSEERAEIEREILRAKRWTFIESGTTHPRFVDLFLEVTTPEQRVRVQAALDSVFGPVAAR